MLKLYQHDLTPAQYAAGQGVICTLPKAIAPEAPLTINGDWSLSFAYPVGSPAADELQLDRLVEADGQLYRIEDVEKIGSADGLRLQIHAVHLVYDLRRKHIVNIETAETTPGGVSQAVALDQILHGTPFTRGTVDTDIVLDYLDILQKDAMWALKEQVLPLWGGELQPDNWTVNIRKKMGADRGAQLRYGKNIDGVRLKESLDGTITRLHVLGYKNANIEPVNGGKDYIDSPNIGLYAQPIEGLVTFPDDDLPEDLLSKGQAYLATVDTPRISMTVDLARVRGSVQYLHYKDLERVELGDTVTIYHQRLGIDIEARIQARTYDPVSGENLRVTLGNDDRNLYSHIASLQQAAEIIKMIADRKGHIRGERLRGVIDLLTTKLYASGAYTTAQVLEDKGVLLENTDEASVDYGALYAGPGIFAIASEKDNTGQWIWRTFGTGQGFVGHEIIAHTITANKLASDVGQQLDLSSNEAITQLAEDVDEHGQRLQAAEQKITPAAITQTVRNHANYKADLAGKNRTFVGGTPSGMIAGDLWIDSANGNLLKRYNGSSWQAVQDGAISIAQQQADKIQWLVASGTSSSNMTLTSQLYSLMAANIDLSANNSIKLAVGAVQVGGANMLAGAYGPSDTTDWGLYDIPATLMRVKYADYPVPYFAITGIPAGVRRVDFYSARVYRLSDLGVGDKIAVQVQVYAQNNGNRLTGVNAYVWSSANGYSALSTALTFVRPNPGNGAWREYAGVLTITKKPLATDFVFFDMRLDGDVSTVYVRGLQVERGNKHTAVGPAPEDPASGVQASGVDIGPARVRLYSTGKLLGEGAEVDFDTTLFNLHDADKEILTATSGGVAVGADHINAKKYLGPIVGTHPGGTIPWKGGFAATLNGLPKYLLNDATISVPAGTYNEPLMVRGFCGAKLMINLAAGVTITRYIDVRYCDAVTITGASDMTSIIQPLTDYQGIYVESVKQIYIQYLRVTGRVRTNASNGTTNGILINAALGEVMDCIIERVNNAIRCNRGCLIYSLNNRGGVVGGSDYATLANLANGVQALAGSHVGIYGTIPTAPTATSTFAGTITGTGTPTGSPGTAPPAPTTVVRNYAQSVAAGYVVQNTTDYQGFSTSRKPAQGISGVFRFAGVWMLPTITNASTATVAKLTITRAASDGSTAAVNIRLMYVTATWATISGSSRTSAGVNALFTATGHEVALERGQSITIVLNATMLSLLKNGTLKGFGVAHSYTPWVTMEATIDLEVTTAS